MSATGGAGLRALDRLEAELDVIGSREATIGAWVCRPDDDALRASVESAERAGGPMAGWTLGVKDVIDTAEFPTCAGTPIYAGRRAVADAACVTAARTAGAVIAGKTETTEFAVLEPARTTNPHEPTRTPGGSSSGSAAAVAAGMVRVAFGTQTAGSVIRPASFCGVYGFKPTFNLVPVRGVNATSASLDTVGWFARTVDDCAALLTALGPAHGTSPPTSAPVSAPVSAPTSPPTSAPSESLRVGFYRSHEWGAALPETVAAVDAACAAFADAGASVQEVAPVDALESMSSSQMTIMFCELARHLAWERAHHDDELSALLRKLLATGDAISAESYAAAIHAAEAGRRAFDELLSDRVDVLLTAAAPGEAPDIKTTGDPVFCRVWTLLGAPALSVPTAVGPSGLPVGVQLIGARYGDHALLDVARLLDADR